MSGYRLNTATRDQYRTMAGIAFVDWGGTLSPRLSTQVWAHTRVYYQKSSGSFSQERLCPGKLSVVGLARSVAPLWVH